MEREGSGGVACGEGHRVEKLRGLGDGGKRRLDVADEGIHHVADCRQFPLFGEGGGGEAGAVAGEEPGAFRGEEGGKREAPAQYGVSQRLSFFDLPGAAEGEGGFFGLFGGGGSRGVVERGGLEAFFECGLHGVDEATDALHEELGGGEEFGVGVGVWGVGGVWIL